MEAESPHGLSEDIPESPRLMFACSHTTGTKFILLELNPMILETILLEAGRKKNVCVVPMRKCLQVSLFIPGVSAAPIGTLTMAVQCHTQAFMEI